MMTIHPDVQQRAQDEIDRVMGKGRLPTIEDQSALPYNMAVIKEVLRFAPAVPLGMELFYSSAHISHVQFNRSTT